MSNRETLDGALCRVGLHEWSETRGGIKVCLRSGCQSARTFGMTGMTRTKEFEEDLYEDYHRYVESGDDD